MNPNLNIDHSEEAIFYNRYFADFFVSEARKNYNHFDSYDIENSLITENYERTMLSIGSAYLF